MQNKSFLSKSSHWIVYLFFIVFYGCQSNPHLSDPVDITFLPPRICNQEMVVSGRISIQYTLLEDTDNKSLYGKFNWKSDKDKVHIDLISPLGQTLAMVDIFPNEAVFTASGKNPVHADNAETLLFRQLGWYLPISDMQNWLQGCIINEKDRLLLVNPNKPKITTSNGWQIHYVSWKATPENKRAPHRIDMIFTPSPSAKTTINQIQIRLIIDKW